MWSWKLNSFYLQLNPHLRGHKECVLWGWESFQSISEFCLPQKDTGQFRQRYTNEGDHSFHIWGYVFCRRNDERREENHALHNGPSGCSLGCSTTPATVVSNSVILWNAAHQAPLSIEFSKQEYWGMFPCPSPGDLRNPEIKPTSLVSPELACGFFTPNAWWHHWEAWWHHCPQRSFAFSTCCFVAS